MIEEGINYQINKEKSQMQKISSKCNPNRAEVTASLPRESYLKYSNLNNEQFNDFNYWKLPVPLLYDEEFQKLKDEYYEDDNIDNILNPEENEERIKIKLANSYE